jgi:hypothetical protein
MGIVLVSCKWPSGYELLNHLSFRELRDFFLYIFVQMMRVAGQIFGDREEAR